MPPNASLTRLLQPEQLKPAVDLTSSVLTELDRILLGQPNLHRMVLIGLLSQGHILLEGVPGVGKTMLVKTLAGLLGLSFSRVQFTPDLMPGDILGTHILQERQGGHREMVFQPGPVFTNLLLADEINRASPKTQSALLEAMQERHVTLLGNTRPLPVPFFVLASQHPIELEGTYPLPEAQLDRFLFKLKVAPANVDTLDRIISSRRRGTPPTPAWNVSADQLNTLFDVMEHIYLPRPVSRYISRLTAATNPVVDPARSAPAGSDPVANYVSYGASPRAAIAMAEAARANALIAGRPTVGFEDVRAVAPAVLNHRVLLNYKARFDRVDSYTVIDTLLGSVKEAEIDLPDDVTLGPLREQES